NPETRWSGNPGHNSGGWFELDWQTPQTVGEVVVRQYDRFVTQWDFQIWDDGSGEWVTKGHYGNANERLAIVVLIRIAPTQRTRIRLAKIEKGPSFNEVEVYSNPQEYKAAVEAASDVRGNLIGMVTD